MIQAKIIEIEDQKRIALAFRYNKEIHNEVKRIPGRKWNKQDKYWHIPDTRTNRARFGLPLYFSSPVDNEKR